MISHELKTKHCILLLGAVGLLILNAHAMADGGKILKWVDEKGVTHYGDTIPPQYAGRDNSVISSQGVTVKRNQAPKPIDEAANKQSQAQQRHDNSLLSAYSSAAEIDLARDRSLAIDKANVLVLEQHKQDVQGRIDEAKKPINILQSQKRPVPGNLTDALAAQQAELGSTNRQLAQMVQAMNDRRDSYDNDKKRFLELKPLENNLKDVRYSEADLRKLMQWRDESQTNYDNIQAQVSSYTRRGNTAPDYLVKQLQDALQQLTSVNTQIAQTQAEISKSQKALGNAGAAKPN